MKELPNKGISPLEIANSLIVIAAEAESPVSHLKLQKLVYYAHGWWLALTGTPLINEQISLWQHGPVVESLYHKFKDFGSRPIEIPEPDIEADGDIVLPLVSKEDMTTLRFLKRIWDTYGNYEPIALSSMTHKEGTPWEQTRTQRGFVGGGISNNLIMKYFKSVAEQKK